MRTMAYAVGAVAMIALLAIAGRYVGKSPPAPRAHPADPAGTAMSRQIEELERKVDALRSSQAHPEPVPHADEPSPARGAAAVRAQASPLTDEERRARAIDREHQLASRLDRRIEQEAIDDAWANTVAREMSDSM